MGHFVLLVVLFSLKFFDSIHLTSISEQKAEIDLD